MVFNFIFRELKKKELFIIIFAVICLPQITHASWIRFNKESGQIMEWSRYDRSSSCDCDREGYTGTENIIELAPDQEVDDRLERYSTTTASIIPKTEDEVTAYDLKFKRLGDIGDISPYLSSNKYKEDVKDLYFDTNKFLSLEPVNFQWKGTTKTDVGFIAEAVEEIMPELVVHNPDGTPEGVRYDKLPIYLFQIVKDHAQRLDALDGGLSGLATSTASTTPSTTEPGPSNAWAVDQVSGKVNVSFFGNINMQGNGILDIGRMAGMFGRWSIDEEGNMIVKEIKAEKIQSAKGYTVPDEDTGELFCIKVKGGALQALLGECGVIAAPLPSTSSESTTSEEPEESELSSSTTTPQVPPDDPPPES